MLGLGKGVLGGGAGIGGELALFGVAAARAGVAVGVFECEQGLLFDFQRFGEVHQERLQSLVERHVEEGGADEVEDHEGEGTPCFGHGKETEQTYDGEVDAGGGLLEGAWVDQALGVDVGVVDVEEVVAIGQIDEIEADCCKA